jgi:RimJ/RimL family protein N-acetyltransferase
VPNADPLSEVELRPVDEDLLERLVQAAVTDASADEVTPPLTPGDEWTPERLEWMRAFHRECRAGLDGPAGQVTWAVVVDGAVVGAVRLKRSDESGVLETGIWLTRGARGRAVGRRALAAVLERAAAAGAAAVSADTATGNVAALAVLRRLGFQVRPPTPDGRVPARRELSEGASPQTSEGSDPTKA